MNYFAVCAVRSEHEFAAYGECCDRGGNRRENGAVGPYAHYPEMIGYYFVLSLLPIYPSVTNFGINILLRVVTKVHLFFFKSLFTNSATAEKLLNKVNALFSDNNL